MDAKRVKRRLRLWWGDPVLRRRRIKRFKTSVFIAVIIGTGFATNRYVPSQHLPWRAINVDAPIGLSTRMQLMRVSLSPSSTCTSLALSAQAMTSLPADPKRVDGQPCGWDTARLYYGSESALLSPGEATMQCPLSLGSYIWTRAIDRAAQEHFDQSLTAIYHAGTYSCRRQRGNNSGAWSEHAFANAFDVTGFKLSDGRVISVLEHWDGTREERRFLRDVRDDACRIFRVTLSPDYNAAHADHFHVDMGPSTACR